MDVESLCFPGGSPFVDEGKVLDTGNQVALGGCSSVCAADSAIPIIQVVSLPTGPECDWAEHLGEKKTLVQEDCMRGTRDFKIRRDSLAYFRSLPSRSSRDLVAPPSHP